MSLIDVLMLAFALSMDACVVSFSNGLVIKKNRYVNSLLLAFFVGFFQFLMPLIGYFFTGTVSKLVQPYSHWIVFIIFLVLGIKFIADAREEKKLEPVDCYLCFKYLLLISVATSIDALSAGISLSFNNNGILYPALIIGLITFINSLVGFYSGCLFKEFSAKKLEIFGGIVLILLAFKLLFENL